MLLAQIVSNLSVDYLIQKNLPVSDGNMVLSKPGLVPEDLRLSYIGTNTSITL